MAELFDLPRIQYVREKTLILADRVRAFRENAGFSQQDFAIKCGLARSTITEVESGVHQNVSLSTILTIGWVLEKPPAELFGFIPDQRRISPEEFELINSHRRIFGRLT